VKYAFAKVKQPLFVEDTGLFIDAFGGFPGPYTHFALDTLGRKGVLKLMENIENRKASFRTIIAYADKKGKVHTFEGKVEGTIAVEEAGNSGFGFDPIFIPVSREKTFAQDPRYKMAVSHRIRALRAFSRHLKNKGL